MMLYLFFIHAILILDASSAVIDRKAEQSSDDFGSSENFLTGVVEIPNVPHGSGKVHEISEKSSNVNDKKEELDKLLGEIYENFVMSDKSIVKDAVPTTTTTTTKPIDFTDLESAVDNLIKELSKGPVKKKELVVENNDVKKFSSFHDYEMSKDKTLNERTSEKPLHDNVRKISYEDFKKKFTKTFLDTSAEQLPPFGGKKKNDMDSKQKARLPFGGKKKNDIDSQQKAKLPFGGKKKNDIDSKQTASDDSLNTKSLSELYEELKKEVQLEKDNLKKKIVSKKIEEPPMKKTVINNNAEILEEKKKEITSLIDNLISEQKSVFNGKIDGENKLILDANTKKTDANTKKTEEKKNVKNVEEVFVNSFKRGLNADDTTNKRTIEKEETKVMNLVNDYIDNNRKSMENQEDIPPPAIVKKEVATKTIVNSDADSEKLRKNIIDLIKVLDTSLKKDVKSSNDQISTVQESDAAEYEVELKSVAEKKESEKSIDNMIELLKGFDVDTSSNKVQQETKREKDRP